MRILSVALPIVLLLIGATVLACKSETERRDEFFREQGLESVRPLIDPQYPRSPVPPSSLARQQPGPVFGGSGGIQAATPRPPQSLQESQSLGSLFPAVVGFTPGGGTLSIKIAATEVIYNVQAYDDHGNAYKGQSSRQFSGISPMVVSFTVRMPDAAPLAKLEVNGQTIPVRDGQPEMRDVGNPITWHANAPNALVKGRWIKVGSFVSVRRASVEGAPGDTHSLFLEIQNTDYNPVEVWPTFTGGFTQFVQLQDGTVNSMEVSVSSVGAPCVVTGALARGCVPTVAAQSTEQVKVDMAQTGGGAFAKLSLDFVQQGSGNRSTSVLWVPLEEGVAAAPAPNTSTKSGQDFLKVPQSITPTPRLRAGVHGRYETPTRLKISREETWTFSASGRWCWGGEPDCSDPNGTPVRPDPSEGPMLLESARIGQLIGRVGDWMFSIGSNAQVTMKADGELFLLMNDRIGASADNSGTIRVEISN